MLKQPSEFHAAWLNASDAFVDLVPPIVAAGEALRVLGNAEDTRSAAIARLQVAECLRQLDIARLTLGAAVREVRLERS